LGGYIGRLVGGRNGAGWAGLVLDAYLIVTKIIGSEIIVMSRGEDEGTGRNKK